MAVVHATYARSLFQAAQEAGRLEQVHDDLAEFVRAVRDVPELRSLLRNPELNPREKAAALEQILADADVLVRNFLRLLAHKGRAGEVEDIAVEFERLVARQQGRLAVELTTAIELSDADAEAILRQIEQVSGRKVDATRKVDPELIGGLVLQAGSLRADASVRGRLERLRHELATARS